VGRAPDHKIQTPDDGERRAVRNLDGAVVVDADVDGDDALDSRARGHRVAER
jgi:hypothetical protein